MNISYPIYEKNNSETCQQFIVFLKYKLQLKAYSKKQFDPFVEGKELHFTIQKMIIMNQFTLLWTT